MTKKIILIVFVFLEVLTASSQNFQTVQEINNECAQLGFMSNEEAELTVDKILEEIGLGRNFVLIECPNINNAVAKNIKSPNGEMKRYILYDNDFFNRINDKASNDWAAISILAHEIGHHLSGHALNNKGSNHKWELEADYFSGSSLAKMGATLEQAQSAIYTLKYEKATATHPAKIDRLEAIKKGWKKGNGKSSVNTMEDERKEKAINTYRKGEIAYQNHNYEASILFFMKASDLGNFDSYYYLSTMYAIGQGVIQNSDKAYELARIGANNGSIPSTYQLGILVAAGQGTRSKQRKAERLFEESNQIKWFKDQFEKFQTPLMASEIGGAYESGYGGLERDESIAVIWYKIAAKMDEPLAQTRLANLYEKGYGIDKNYPEALRWYRKAAQQGHQSAQDALTKKGENW